MLLRRVKTAPDDREESSFLSHGEPFFWGENCETFTNLEKTHTEMVASYISCMCIPKADLGMD